MLARHTLCFLYMRAIIYSLAIAAFLLNPSCERSRASYLFGMTEVRAALAGTWQANGVTFRIEPGASEHASRSWIRSAAACGDRTLIASAHACMDITRVPLVLIANGTQVGTGTFIIAGETFESGTVEAELAGGHVFARVTARGDVTDGTLAHKS